MMSVAERFSKNLFWDVEASSFDTERHARFIVQRVTTRGRIQDFFTLLELYGRDRIKREVVKIRYLGLVTLNFLSRIFDIPKSRFKCSKQPQSIEQHWTY